MLRYFKKLNLKGPTPLPIFGNMFSIMTQDFGSYDDQLLPKYDRVCGYFEGMIPVILISDTKFIKAITIKDSANFVNRRVKLFHYSFCFVILLI